MKAALTKLNLKCSLTYLILNKRTNLKLFMQDNNNICNSPPGTIVDTKVSSKYFNDFYLISQKTTQGLASCIHYSVIYDDKGTSEIDIQSLVYRLCYLYYNWTGSIKVPAPCQYAHKLAYLLGDKLNDKKNTFIPHSRFSQQIKSLYYL
jgi:aubergine-like protein